MTNPLLIKRLYRSLLRAAKPFSAPSPNAKVLSCLLHRTGIDDGLPWSDDAPSITETSKEEEKKPPRLPKSVEEARDLSRAYADDDEEINMLLPPMPFDERKTPSHILFRRLLREVVTGTEGFRQMQFPAEMDTTRLKSVIRREFRSTTCKFDDTVRQEVAFHALRELNKKLRWDEALEKQNDGDDEEVVSERNRRQAARNVFPLPLDSSSYLKAGTYLIAHPLLTGFFRRTVICILDHSDSSNSARTGGTYGLIVNRIAVSHSSGRRQTLKDVLRSLPPELTQAFGNCSVREGGPVHMSLQMIHARTPEQPALGGTVLSVDAPEESTSTALDSDRAIYYQGNMMDAADAVINGALDRGECCNDDGCDCDTCLSSVPGTYMAAHILSLRTHSFPDDVSFYVGASCWEVGQLESEIDRGYFIPCAGPPDICLTGVCERVGDDDNESKRPKADLWLSMMCSLGQDEANLAHLVSNDEEYSEFSDACDMF